MQSRYQKRLFSISSLRCSLHNGVADQLWPAYPTVPFPLVLSLSSLSTTLFSLLFLYRPSLSLSLSCHNYNNKLFNSVLSPSPSFSPFHTSHMLPFLSPSEYSVPLFFLFRFSLFLPTFHSPLTPPLASSPNQAHPFPCSSLTRSFTLRLLSFVHSLHSQLQREQPVTQPVT